ncbi:MAG: TonB-dependent receptor plug domain-containing protein, partial [Cyclobacteriaceae bacterium]|nr:TonB-dependent receptor plug domain-containing protein [Cyclobacteriaceae bacterium]
MKIKLFRLLIYAMRLSFIGIFLQCLLLNLLIAGNIEAQKYTSVKEVVINIDVKDASVTQVFKELERKTEFQFTYDDNVVSNNKSKISISGQQKTIEEILLHVSKQAKLRFKQVNNNINVKPLKNKSGKKSIEIVIQGITITGRATSSEDNSGLPGVNVIVKGTPKGTVTDVEGNYTLEVPDENSILVFSSVGYVTEEIAVGGRSVIDIVMATDVTSLSEIVVTAFGIEREKKALGYSAQELEGEELSAAREINIANYLTGKVAGVQVSNSSSGTGGSTTVTIRGNSSLTGNNQPLYVVDGIPIINQGHSNGGLWGDNDYGDGVGNINPEDVESISVLKGPNASSLYGSRGANGVILITTKSGKSRKGIGVDFNSTTSIETLNLIPERQNKYATGYEGTNLYGSIKEIDGEPYETMPTWHGDSWGPPLDGRRTVVEPFLFPGEEMRTRVLLPQDPNNIREFWDTGLILNNMISFSGGNENSSARLSIGNTNYKGITPNHTGNRNTINLRATSKLSKRLSFDGKINYTNAIFDNRPNLGSSADNVTYTMVIQGRYVPMDFLKEYYERTGTWGRWPGVMYNPYYNVNELKNHDEKDRIIGFGSLRYEFMDWLNLTLRSGIDWYADEREKIWPVGARGSSNSKGRMIEDVYNVKETNSDFLLTAVGNLSSNFHGSFSVGGNLLKQSSSRMSWDARDFKA